MGRKIIRHEFGDIGGSAKRSFTGEAIGELGEVLKGLDVPTFEKDQEPNKTSPDLASFQEPTFNVEAQQLEGDTSYLDSLTGKPFKSRPVGSISNTPATSPSSTNPYVAFPANEAQAGAYEGLNYDPKVLYQAPKRQPSQYNALPGTYTPTGVDRTLGSPLNRNGKDGDILARKDGKVQIEGPGGKPVWVKEAPKGSEAKYEQYLKTFHEQRGPDAKPLDIHHAAASGYASPAQSLLAYKSKGRTLGEGVGANKRVPTLQDLETIGLADHPLMKKAYPQLFDGSGGMTMTEDSPLNRTRVDLTTDNISAAKGGYLGARADIRGAAAAGFNQAVERHNYKQKVWADKAAEADLEFGKLNVDPSGVSAWDASTEIMAREWKSELGDLLTNKDDYDPQDFVAKKQEILARSKQFNTAAQNIQKVVGDYNTNLDNISAGTDPDVMDLLNTLNKGGQGIGVKNIDGVPTMVGETSNGNPVNIPISEIASGRNAFRFAVKEDIQPGLNKITQSLSKIKKDRQIAGGLQTGLVGWDQLQSSAEPQVDALLNKASTVRAVMADRFNMDFDDLKTKYPKVNSKTGEVEADIDKARQEAKRMLMEDLQKQISPYQQATSIKKDPRLQTQAGSAVDKRSAADAQAIAGQINQIPDKSFNAAGLQQFVGGNINGIQELEGGRVGIVLSNGKGVKLNSDPKVARTQLARILGIDERHVGQIKSPLPRIASESPFKRLMNFMTTPFKRNGKDKNPEGTDKKEEWKSFDDFKKERDTWKTFDDFVEERDTWKTFDDFKKERNTNKQSMINRANAQNKEWRKQGYSKAIIDSALRREFPELYN